MCWEFLYRRNHFNLHVTEAVELGQFCRLYISHCMSQRVRSLFNSKTDKNTSITCKNIQTFNFRTLFISLGFSDLAEVRGSSSHWKLNEFPDFREISAKSENPIAEEFQTKNSDTLLKHNYGNFPLSRHEWDWNNTCINGSFLHPQGFRDTTTWK